MMIELTNLTCGSSTRLPGGTLHRSAWGRVTVSTERGVGSIVDGELADADGLSVARGADALVALGDASHDVLGWDATGGGMRVVGSVARLDLSGYDPGGLKRVHMHPVDEDRLVLETEVGFSLVDLRQGVKWSLVHDDLTARVVRVCDGVVQITSEGGDATFSVRRGSFLGGESRA